MKIHFTIPIVPKAQKRDRIGSFGGHGRSYKDKTQSQYEGKVAALIAQYRPEKPLEGMIELSVVAYLPIPKSKSKKWKQDALKGWIRPITKPDCTNITKNIEDIMNGVFYRDDSQIIESHTSKWYSDTPRWDIIIDEVGTVK
jgi:Holliday junction resolvase RusA-like endonuclease